MLVGSEASSTRSSKRSCTLNLDDDDVFYSLQQRSLNGPLNLEDAAVSSIYRVSLNGFSIYLNTLNNRFSKTKICTIYLRV
jgi:hypothetical protein